jgi:hypothetical protein
LQIMWVAGELRLVQISLTAPFQPKEDQSWPSFKRIGAEPSPDSS